MNFDEWWATLSPPERRVIGEHNARFVWKEAVEMCAKVCEDRAASHEEDSSFEEDADYKQRYLVYAKHERRCAEAIRAKGQ